MLNAILNPEDICGYCGHERLEHFEGYAECRGSYGCDSSCNQFEEPKSQA